jgi:hypothetical protein
MRAHKGAKCPLKAKSQNSKILAHLSRGRTVTSMEAFRRFGVTSLHRPGRVLHHALWCEGEALPAEGALNSREAFSVRHRLACWAR